MPDKKAALAPEGMSNGKPEEVLHAAPEPSRPPPPLETPLPCEPVIFPIVE